MNFAEIPHTCYTEAEVVTVLLANVLHEVRGMLEIDIRSDPVFFTPWRVSTECKNVLDAECLCALRCDFQQCPSPQRVVTDLKRSV